MFYRHLGCLSVRFYLGVPDLNTSHGFPKWGRPGSRTLLKDLVAAQPSHFGIAQTRTHLKVTGWLVAGYFFSKGIEITANMQDVSWGALLLQTCTEGNSN